MSWDIDERIYERLMALNKRQLIDVMEAALCEMQSYNGQGVNRAILRAIGSEESESGEMAIPSIQQIRSIFK